MNPLQTAFSSTIAIKLHNEENLIDAYITYIPTLSGIKYHVGIEVFALGNILNLGMFDSLNEAKNAARKAIKEQKSGM